MFDITLILTLLALGLFAGFVAGMFGIGGGGIIVPILTTIFLNKGFSPDLALHMALGTSMATIIVTSFSSFRTHNKGGFVVWSIFWYIAPGVIVGTLLGSSIAVRINYVYLALFFSIFMFFSSLKMFFSKAQTQKLAKTFKNYIHFIAGIFIGIISALVSIGGGVLNVPYLNFQGIDIKKAIGTSATIGFPIAIGGTLGYIINGINVTNLNELNLGYVNLGCFFFISFASFLAAPLGAKTVRKIPSKLIKKLFAIIPFTLSIRMFFEILGA